MQIFRFFAKTSYTRNTKSKFGFKFFGVLWRKNSYIYKNKSMQNIQIPVFIKISTCNISLQYSVLLLLGKMFYYFLTLNSRHPVRKKTRQYPFPMTSHSTYLSSRFLYLCNFQIAKKYTPNGFHKVNSSAQRRSLLEKVIEKRNVAQNSRWARCPHGEGKHFSWGIS